MNNERNAIVRIVVAMLSVLLAAGFWGTVQSQASAEASGLPAMAVDPAPIEFGSFDAPPMTVTLSGAECRPHPGFPASVVVNIDDHIVAATPDDRGSWSVPFQVSPSDSPRIHATCDNYLDSRSYPYLNLAVIVAVPSLGSKRATKLSILGSSTVRPGSSVVVRGRGWATFDVVHLALHSTTAVQLATMTTGEDGDFSARVVIPVDTVPGRHNIVVTGLRVHMSVPITVLGAEAGLAVSGVSSGTGAAYGLVLLLLGTLLTVAGRRPRAVAVPTGSRAEPGGKRTSGP
jgi:hypothetical protein